ncbi:hypothetical protein EUBDOL_00702 [Amedibacillus dolichus DSM 3991]|uniref:Uncharacterized protein n=1 Tax=Amedibacillus dolichus DSM 3991 TaxID=428127 RepID=A8RA45_9FIRM|nr:hypothetical protein EUBDOL_00702 [Amedibacillus dolichus DSM 3991]
MADGVVSNWTKQYKIYNKTVYPDHILISNCAAFPSNRMF